MRVVADTNTIVSALFWSGAPRKVLEAAHTGRIQLWTTPILLAELEEVLARDKFAQRLEQVNVSARDLVLGYGSLAQLIKPGEIDTVILADPDDDEVLACAIACRADAIVSGDSHLLNLKNYKNVRILSAKDLLAEIDHSEK